MPYLRTPFTVILSVMWFMGALPAPAAQPLLPHLIKRVVHSAIHVTKQALHHPVTTAGAIVVGHGVAKLVPSPLRSIKR
ncbi:MAG TPA: hypothetical protein VFW40_06075 [Capsulimonadaceae bacterium]|nr:hypothetical protein [Capsulimonadaceae bacterium]